MLTARITLPTSTAPSPEDIFSSALGSLFTDDTQNSHGSPGGLLIYSSPSFGDITLQIPAHPDVEDGRKLFAHYLWNAAIVVAEGLERGSTNIDTGGEKSLAHEQASAEGTMWEGRWWDVRGKRVLELGAGTALPSIICALTGATSVTITDHPSSPALTTGAIPANVTKNLQLAWSTTEVVVRGYSWGTESTYSIETYGKVAGRLERYDKIILADCLWMASQHKNLVTTISRALETGPGCCAVVVAGFHTGRRIVRDFFDVATSQLQEEELTGSEAGAGAEAEADGNSDLTRLEIAEIYEVDVDGQRREWQRVRPGEVKEEAKRWCVVAILVQP